MKDESINSKLQFDRHQANSLLHASIALLFLSICSLEFWYYMILIVLVGHLKDAQIAVAAVSIWRVIEKISFCFSYIFFSSTSNLLINHSIPYKSSSSFPSQCSNNINGWEFMVFFGFNVAIRQSPTSTQTLALFVSPISYRYDAVCGSRTSWEQGGLERPSSRSSASSCRP